MGNAVAKVALAALILMLPACSGSSDDKDPGAAKASPATAALGKGPLTAEQYHKLMRDNIPAVADRSDEQLDKIGTLGCDILANKDGEWPYLIKTLTESGLSGTDAGTVSVMIVYRFCPEQGTKLPKTLVPDVLK